MITNCATIHCPLIVLLAKFNSLLHLPDVVLQSWIEMSVVLLGVDLQCLLHPMNFLLQNVCVVPGLLRYNFNYLCL